MDETTGYKEDYRNEIARNNLHKKVYYQTWIIALLCDIITTLWGSGCQSGGKPCVRRKVSGRMYE